MNLVISESNLVIIELNHVIGGIELVIDFHTHVFPDKIACRTIEKLETMGKIKAYLNGTKEQLLKSMKEAGIDRSVVMPVVTKPNQFSSVLRFACELSKEEGIISFAGVHPDDNRWKENIRIIKESGCKGIKLHPDYQNTMIDDIKNIRLIDEALKNNLVVVIHAGVDIAFPDMVHCPPKRANNMLCQLQMNEDVQRNIIFAHVGGYRCWDEVEQYLVGKNVVFDLSFSFGKIPKEQLLRIISDHGADRIVFGTDSPWGCQKQSLNQFHQLNLEEEEKELILWRNACNILNIKG